MCVYNLLLLGSASLVIDYTYISLRHFIDNSKQFNLAAILLVVVYKVRRIKTKIGYSVYKQYSLDIIFMCACII